jgi:putative FmdB family regulatory protein
MPVYEYGCEAGHRFEVKQKFSDAPVTSCQICSLPVTKLISASGISFKGSGWYVTDYSNKMKEPTTSEKSTAEKSTSEKSTSEKSTAEKSPSPSSAQNDSSTPKGDAKPSRPASPAASSSSPSNGGSSADSGSSSSPPAGS